MPTTLPHPEVALPKGFLPLHGIDHLELCVGNARQAAFYYRCALGMKLVAYAGPETGRRDRVSYVLEQGSIRLVLTTALRPDGEIAQHVHVHGDGVRDIALAVDDARQAWKETTRRGARSIREPFEMQDRYGRVRMASIAAYGDTIHTFVERAGYAGPFLPGYRAEPEDALARPAGLLEIDHVAGNVGWNEMNRWADFYADILGFSLDRHFDRTPVSTAYSAISSTVMTAGDGLLKFPLSEPAEGRCRSQVEEFLEAYHGPGIQHIALRTDDILSTVAQLSAQGVDFLRAPHAYYRELEARAGGMSAQPGHPAMHAALGSIEEPVGELERLGILVDHDGDGYLLQAFTRPAADRPTLFYEIIQRKGCRGFGRSSFQALFEAIEREQAERGNLLE